MVSGYEDLKPHMQAHEDDRHVLAAAVHGRCDTLVTENTKHFSPPAHGAHAMRVSRLSGLLVRKLNEQPGEVVSAMQAMVEENRRPPRTIPSLIDRDGRQAHEDAAWLRSEAERICPSGAARQQ